MKPAGCTSHSHGAVVTGLSTVILLYLINGRPPVPLNLSTAMQALMVTQIIELTMLGGTESRGIWDTKLLQN